MSDQNAQISPHALRLPDVWSVMAALVAALVLVPIVAVFWLAAFPTENIWPHLVSTTLPRYLSNTLILMAGTGLLAGIVGTGTKTALSKFQKDWNLKITGTITPEVLDALNIVAK